MLRRISLLALCCVVFSGTANVSLQAQQPKPQKLDVQDMERAHFILKTCYEEVKKKYYDPTYHGVDLDASYKQYDARLNSSTSVNDTFRVIAAFLLSLHDSHTFFQPPLRANRSTLGYTVEAIGDKCFITHVRPGTDAATKLHLGDEVLAINGFKLSRAHLWEMNYFFNILSPAPTEQLALQNPAGEQRQEIIKASLRLGKTTLDLSGADGGGDFWQAVRMDEDSERMNDERYIEHGDTLICKMPSFVMSESAVAKMFDRARRHKTLIMDLRGNPGGAISALTEALTYTFSHDVKVADIVSRKDTKPMLVKVRGAQTFTGKLIVLVDSGSASCAELFARVVQIEKRGQVIGDTSSGKVMMAEDVDEFLGTDSGVAYGISVTAANLLMTDGKSLENLGVTPDEVVLPTSQDLADGKDPVLAHALELAGVNVTAEQAGKMFPYTWPKL